MVWVVRILAHIFFSLSDMAEYETWKLNNKRENKPKHLKNKVSNDTPVVVEFLTGPVTIHVFRQYCS